MKPRPVHDGDRPVSVSSDIADETSTTGGGGASPARAWRSVPGVNDEGTTVQVRLFAALRDAAGSTTVEVSATTVAELFSELAATYGEPMTTRLTTATVFVDDVPVRDATSTRSLTDADEVVVVPPFAGG